MAPIDPERGTNAGVDAAPRPIGASAPEPSAGDGRPPERGETPGLCPFCGGRAVAGGDLQCGSCGARTDPLSRQATQNEMGPWFVRDETAPFRPGCRFETIERWVRTGRVTVETIIRGPSTHQNWIEARRVPGVARLFGVCHACDHRVATGEVICRGCGAALETERDRQHLGLSEVRPLPGRVPASVTAGTLLPDLPVRSASGQADGVSPADGALGGRATPDRTTGAGSSSPMRSREALFERHLAGAKRSAWIASAIAFVAVAALVATLLGVRFGLIEPVRAQASPAERIAEPAGEPAGESDGVAGEAMDEAGGTIP
jgi:hypothetical protein